MKKRIVSLVLVLSLFSIFAIPAGANNSKIVALTFDDGPSWKFTPVLLDALAERDVKATFFLVGYTLEVNMDIAKRAFEDGHQLANHTYSHFWFSKLTSKQISEEIETVNTLLNEITGESEFFLRVPYGDITSTTKKTAETPLIQWSVDPTNGRAGTSEEAMLRNLLTTVRDGSIILLHDTNQKNLNVALDAIDALLEEGYEFVTLSELFRLRGVTPANGTVYYNVSQSAAETAFDETRIEDHWAYESIRTVSEYGIILGDGEGFKPNEYLSRAMAATILMRLAAATDRLAPSVSNAKDAGKAEGAAGFNDIPAGLWFSEAVIWAHENSYVKGVSEKSFDPYSYITKEQFYTILARFAADKLDSASIDGEPAAYRDDARISDYARESIALIRNAGFSSANDPEIFRPGDNMTRAEAAELISFVLQLFEVSPAPSAAAKSSLETAEAPVETSAETSENVSFFTTLRYLFIEVCKALFERNGSFV